MPCVLSAFTEHQSRTGRDMLQDAVPQRYERREVYGTLREAEGVRAGALRSRPSVVLYVYFQVVSESTQCWPTSHSIYTSSPGLSPRRFVPGGSVERTRKLNEGLGESW